MTIEEDLKKKIMHEGFPLQRYCSTILQNQGWNVEEEYPVQWISPPQSQHKTVRTSGDIRAEFQYVAKSFGVRICVSCKKQSSINWVFMKAMFNESDHFFLRSCALKPTPEADYKNSWEYEYSFRKNDWPESYPLCNIPTTLKGNSNGEESNKILQAADNLHLEVTQTISDDSIPLASILPIDQLIYVPVIVTAAEVYVYDIDFKKFDVDDVRCISIEKVPYLLYQHTLPIGKQRLVNNPHFGEQVKFEKFNIFVVHYKQFERFAKIIKEQFASKSIALPIPNKKSIKTGTNH
ncbi:MAG: hypothetical protein KGI27_04695 [Thaumarchaeota archaeon]|nr:hypothetical protein [Nitrososphaerota archaeon]